jgi:hypothetical protein
MQKVMGENNIRQYLVINGKFFSGKEDGSNMK